MSFGGGKRKMGKSPNKSPKRKLPRLLVVLFAVIAIFASKGLTGDATKEANVRTAQVREEETVEASDSELEKFVALKQKMATFFNNPAGFLRALNNIGTINDDQAKQELDDLKNEMKKVLAVQTRIDSIDISAIDLDSKDEIDSILADLQDIDGEVIGFVDTEKHESAVRTIDHLAKNTPQGKVIAAIFALSDITIESKSEIENIRAMYEALSDSEKSEIINYAQLTEAERQYDVLVIAAAEAGAAQAAEEEAARQGAEEEAARQAAEEEAARRAAEEEAARRAAEEEAARQAAEEEAARKAAEAEAAAAAAAAQASAPTETPADVTYIGNSRSYKFHYPWCGSVKQMAEHNKVYFYCGRQEIIEKGYKPCGNCNP